MKWVQLFATWAIPLLLLGVPLTAYFRRVRVYEVFCEGAKEGFETAIRILPYLVAMFVAIGVMRESQALDGILAWVASPAQALGIDPKLLPLAIMRPISGSGSLGILADLLRKDGPDSIVGLIASTMQGSTETTFYILTVYFGAVGITRARYALAVGLIGDAAGFIASIFAVHWLFG